jgi:hypothetical protein
MTNSFIVSSPIIAAIMTDNSMEVKLISGLLNGINMPNIKKHTYTGQNLTLCCPDFLA